MFEPIAEDELPKNPTSDFASVCGEHIEKVEEYWSEKQYDREKLKEQLKKAGQSDETIEKFIEIAEEDEEVFEPDYVDEVDEIENDCGEIRNETPEIENNKYNFATRTGVREFLHNYMNWERMIGFIGCFFNGLYRYRFKNGISLIAATGVMVTGNGEELSSQSKVKMYIWENESEKAKEITQNQLEKYIAAHLSEL